MNRLSVSLRQRVITACCTFALALTACTEDVADDNSLPDGRYPMTFTTTVQGLTQTRATVDNTWAGTEEVAVMAGNTVKKYKAAYDGALAPDGADNQLYWTSKTMTVQAWHSDTYSDTRPEKFTVQPGQNNGTGYQQSDMLYAIASVSYSGGSSASLEFKHLPAKVVVNLKADTQNGITEADVTNATVTLVNQALTSGTITVDEEGKTYTVAQAVSGSDGITPQKSGQTVSGYQQTVQALVVPQQMQGRKFIKVTIGADAAARDYYYTPTTEVDGKLETGKCYQYAITVKKEGLQVESVFASWDEKTSEDDLEPATFKVHLPAFNAPENTSNYKVTNASDVVLTAQDDGTYSVTDKINISLSAAEDYRLKTFWTSVKAGICKWKGSYDAGTCTYTYTFYDIRSDLWLNEIKAEAEETSTSLPNPEVGDYYYVDGTWSSTLEKPCIGIVFHVGVGKDDSENDWLPEGNTIRGYVVALNDAHTDAGAWGIRLVDVDGIDNMDDQATKDKYDGYKNTTVIRQLDAYKTTDVSQPLKNGQYWAFRVASEYSVTAPSTTSGWYLPSVQQLADIYSLPDLAGRLTAAGGADFKRTENDGRYWSATEKNEYDAWYYLFASGSSDRYGKSKDGGNYLDKSYVRSILTF